MKHCISTIRQALIDAAYAAYEHQEEKDGVSPLNSADQIGLRIPVTVKGPGPSETYDDVLIAWEPPSASFTHGRVIIYGAAEHGKASVTWIERLGQKIFFRSYEFLKSPLSKSKGESKDAKSKED
jgi:hypothetical protein